MQDLMRRFSEAVATLYAAGERPRHWDDALRAACRYSGAETLRVEVVSRVPGREVSAAGSDLDRARSDPADIVFEASSSVASAGAQVGREGRGDRWHGLALGALTARDGLSGPGHGRGGAEVFGILRFLVPSPEDAVAVCDRLGYLVPHIRSTLARVVEMSEGGGDAAIADLLSETMTMTGMAYLVVARSGRIVSQSDGVADLIAHAAPLTIFDGLLSVNETRLAERLATLIAAAADDADGPARSIGIPRGNGRLPLSLGIKPLTPGLRRWLSAPVMIFVCDPERDAFDHFDEIATFYRLTAAERRLLAAIAAGTALSDYVSQSGISLNTAKTHLQSVYRKTGTSNRVSLVCSFGMCNRVRGTSSTFAN